MPDIALFLVRRIVLLGITLLAASILIFTITQLLPGDVATMILGTSATPEDLATLRNRLGLDHSATSQYLDWLRRACQGDLGYSTRFSRPVAEVLAEPLRRSAILGAAGAAVAVPVGIWLGMVCALRRDGLLDRAISMATIFAAAMPEFVTGGLLIVIFSGWLGWLPAFVSVSSAKPWTQAVLELIMPIAALSLVILAYILRMMRAGAIEVLASGYVKAAILKGMGRGRILRAHVLPMALGPTLQVVALSVGWMAGGLVVVESLFGYPGIGRLLIFAIQNRDVPLLQAITLIIAATYAAANLCADLAQRALDPRVAA